MRMAGADRRGRQDIRLALAALTLALAASPALGQRFDATSPVTGQPDNPGIGQDTGPNGLPALRRRVPDGLSRDDGRTSSGGDATGGEQTGGDSLRSPLSPAIPTQSQPGL